MIIACPNCAKRYRINDDAVPVEGRTVRCAACKTAWFQASPPPEAVMVDLPPQPEPAPEPVAPAPPMRQPVPIAAHPARTPSDAASGLIGNLGLAMLAICLGLTVLLLRPGGFRGLDLGRGLDPEMPGSALTLELHEPIWGRVLDGRTVLTIVGKLSNPTFVPLAALPLEAEVRDADGRLLAKWTSPPPVTNVPSGTTITFDTATIGMSATARTVSIKFADTRRK